jgi:hypothetical protein
MDYIYFYMLHLFYFYIILLMFMIYLIFKNYQSFFGIEKKIMLVIKDIYFKIIK